MNSTLHFMLFFTCKSLETLKLCLGEGIEKIILLATSRENIDTLMMNMKI